MKLHSVISKSPALWCGAFFVYPRRDKALRSYSVLRKAVSHAASRSTSRRGRAALRTSLAQNAAQAADGTSRLPRHGILKGLCAPLAVGGEGCRDSQGGQSEVPPRVPAENSLAETIVFSQGLVVDVADTFANVQRKYCLKYRFKSSEL